MSEEGRQARIVLIRARRAGQQDRQDGERGKNEARHDAIMRRFRRATNHSAASAWIKFRVVFISPAMG
jgi:hypothetical protein